MKKRNQAPEKKGKTAKKTAQQKARRRLIKIEVPMAGRLRRAVEQGARKLSVSPSLFIEQAIREHLPRIETAIKSAQQPSFEIMISRRRGDLLLDLAKQAGAEAKLLGENAIKSYLDCVDEYPHLVEAQRRFVRCDSLLTTWPGRELADRIASACEIHDLDRNSLADTAVGLWVDIALGENPIHRAGHLESKGKMDPHQIAYHLEKLSGPADTMFGQLVEQFSARPFYQACGDFAALRGLVMHHPSLKTEREALEMIVEGADRLT